MPRFRIAPEHRLRYALAIIAGVLLALAFPRVSIAGLAWIAPGLLLFAAIGLRPGLAFRVGYFGGFASFPPPRPATAAGSISAAKSATAPPSTKSPTPLASAPSVNGAVN